MYDSIDGRASMNRLHLIQPDNDEEYYCPATTTTSKRNSNETTYKKLQYGETTTAVSSTKTETSEDRTTSSFFNSMKIYWKNLKQIYGIKLLCLIVAGIALLKGFVNKNAY